MTIVAQFSWDDIADVHFTNPARTAWRAAVAEITAKAKAALPESNGRVEKAAAIVLNGDVALLPDGTAKVASQSNGTTEYVVVNGICECPDFAKAPHNFCKHRLSTAIARRAQELAKAKLDAAPNAPAPEQAQPAPTVPASAPALPEAPASVNCHVTIAGRQVQVTLRDSDETRLLARLEALLAQFPAEADSAEQESPEGWCHKHGVQMKRHSNPKGAWWSHKTTDGWCRGK